MYYKGFPEQSTSGFTVSVCTTVKIKQSVSRRETAGITDTAKALAYMLKQWDALNEYCRNGWVELDNNLCENALRVVALGRRNYMFFGSDGGGDSAAVMYSLIGSCKLNGIEPEKWLRYVINIWPANRVKELLPWNATLSVN